MKCLLVSAATLAAALLVSAVDAQQMFRYVDPDGRVVYTDRPPPAGARNIEQKKLRGNVIETSELPVVTRDAQRRNPVNLFVFDCGDVCDRAQGLLNRRGVPHSRFETTNADNAEKLKKLTGSAEVPVLQVGGQVLKGFSETQWQAALDAAGYPRTPGIRAAMSGRAEQLNTSSAAPAIPSPRAAASASVDAAPTAASR